MLFLFYVYRILAVIFYIYTKLFDNCTLYLLPGAFELLILLQLGKLRQTGNNDQRHQPNQIY